MTLEASSAPRWDLGFEACRVPTLTLHLTVKHTTLDCGDLLYDGCLSYLDWRCCEGSDYVPFKIVISTWHSNWANEYLLNKFSSVHFSHSVVSNSLRPHESQHASNSNKIYFIFLILFFNFTILYWFCHIST